MRSYLKIFRYLIVSVLLTAAIVFILMRFEPLGWVSILALYVLSIVILHVASEWASRRIKNGNTNSAIMLIYEIPQVNLAFKLIVLVVLFIVIPILLKK